MKERVEEYVPPDTMDPEEEEDPEDENISPVIDFYNDDGEAVEDNCPRCGNPTWSTFRFCPLCGEPITDEENEN